MCVSSGFKGVSREFYGCCKHISGTIQEWCGKVSSTMFLGCFKDDSIIKCCKCGTMAFWHGLTITQCYEFLRHFFVRDPSHMIQKSMA